MQDIYIKVEGTMKRTDTTTVIWLAAFALLLVYLTVGCAAPPAPKPTAYQLEYMARQAAMHDGVPMPSMSLAPSAVYPYGSDSEPMRPRGRVNCMQYGTMGQGGQFSCW